MLETLIKSKTRLRLIIKFFVNIANEGYLNSLANEFEINKFSQKSIK